MYEGAPNSPHDGRFWEIIEKYRVTIFYTAPTAIRTFMKWGDQWPNEARLSSLRLLGSVGEPINPEAWIWYRRIIGGDRLRRRHVVADRNWRHHDQSAPRCHRCQARGSATRPLPGVSADVRGLRAASRSPNGGWRVPAPDRAVAGDVARHLGRAMSVIGRPIGLGSPNRGTTSRAMARRRTTTATCGCSGGWTT